MESIGIAVIGFGWMGQAHSRSYARIPSLFPDRLADPELVICCDNLPDRAAEASHYVVNAFELRQGVGAEALVTPGTAQHEGLLRAVHRASYVQLDAPASDASRAQMQ